MCMSDVDLCCDECRKKCDEIFYAKQKPDFTLEDEEKARQEWYRSLCPKCREVLKKEGFIS